MELIKSGRDSNYESAGGKSPSSRPPCIGRAIALAFAAEARRWRWPRARARPRGGRRRDPALAAAARSPSHDVTNDGAVEALVEQTASDFKRVDPGHGAGTRRSPRGDTKPADWT